MKTILKGFVLGLFRQAFEIAQSYWSELGAEGWMDWYYGSAFERAVRPLDKQARSILDGKGGSLFKYWVDYARRDRKSVV